MTIGTWENFRTENIQFKATDFETAYNTFLGRPMLSKFVAIPHYVYLVSKIPRPHGIISTRGDIKQAFDYDRVASVELQELKQALVESSPDPGMPEAKISKMSIQPEDTLRRQSHCPQRNVPRWLT
jgi:hypothetical protein